jgi:hypothetical protein
VERLGDKLFRGQADGRQSPRPNRPQQYHALAAIWRAERRFVLGRSRLKVAGGPRLMNFHTALASAVRRRHVSRAQSEFLVEKSRNSIFMVNEPCPLAGC